MAEDNTQVQPTLEEVNELLQEYEQYRERLVKDTVDAAKRAKMPKQETMAKLEPQLVKIDAAIEQLKAQKADLLAAEDR
ncbi:MAG: hypothetical protein F6J97_26130 [Leptolyngbya sp. SIO4C1]|nr:hypothetical protein [Leptolyngbya sp. SIO4C1]